MFIDIPTDGSGTSYSQSGTAQYQTDDVLEQIENRIIREEMRARHYNLSHAIDVTIQDFNYYLRQPINHPLQARRLDQEIVVLNGGEPITSLLTGEDIRCEKDFVTQYLTPDQKNAVYTQVVLSAIKIPHMRQLLDQSHIDLSKATFGLGGSVEFFNHWLEQWLHDPEKHPILPTDIEKAIFILNSSSDYLASGTLELSKSNFELYLKEKNEMYTELVLTKITNSIIRAEIQRRGYDLSHATDAPNGGTIKTFNDFIHDPNHYINNASALDHAILALNNHQPTLNASDPASVDFQTFGLTQHQIDILKV